MTSAGVPSATSAPLCKTMMRSASSRTTSILCSTSRMVLVLSCRSWRIKSSMAGISSAPRPAVGSSNMNTLGSSAISMATSSLRWSPCDRSATRLSARLASHTVSSTSRARDVRVVWSLQMRHKSSPCRWAPLCTDCTARRTFSNTVSPGNRLVNWKARPNPAWVRADADRVERSWPSSMTLPRLAGSRPEIKSK